MIDNPYAKEAEALWANEYRASVKRFGLLTDSQQAEAVNQGETIRDELAPLFLSGLAADADRVQALIKAHHDWVCLFWSPTREQYIALGEMYSADPRFTEFYDVKAKGLTEFIGEAIRVWSEANL